MFVLCVLYSKDERQSQDNQNREVQMKYREQKEIKVGGEIFRTCPALGPTQPPIYNGHRFFSRG